MEDLNAKEGNKGNGELVGKYRQEPVKNTKKMGPMVQRTRQNIKQTLVLRARKRLVDMERSMRKQRTRETR